MGYIDRSVRSTARAVGRVRGDGPRRIYKFGSDEPDVALKIIGNLSERLRHTNGMVTSPALASFSRRAPEAVNLDIDRRAHCKAPYKKTLLNFVWHLSLVTQKGLFRSNCPYSRFKVEIWDKLPELPPDQAAAGGEGTAGCPARSPAPCRKTQT